MNPKIGIFDSGSGGLSTLAAIRELLPNAEYYYIGDVAHCPYGTKTPEELLEITSTIVKRLQNWGAQIIVIACNTATTRCIHQLRQRFPNITFVGTEPALKVAHDHNFHHPLLLCTPATARAKSVQRLIHQNYPDSPLFIGDNSPFPATQPNKTNQATILPCVGLADTIENALTNPKEIQLASGDTLPDFSIPDSAGPIINAKLQSLFNELPNQQFDCVVLGCTHYVLIPNLIQKFFPTAKLIDGNAGVARYVAKTIHS